MGAAKQRKTNSDDGFGTPLAGAFQLTVEGQLPPETGVCYYYPM